VAAERATGWPGLRRLPPESALRALLVTLLVCAVCSASIALAVSWLRPLQQAHRARDRAARIQQLLASVPGVAALLEAGGPVALEAQLVDLDTGESVDAPDAARLDPRELARDTEGEPALPPERDGAQLGRRQRQGLVYLVRDGAQLRLVVLPVHGAGYASTLYGYLALDADLRTIRGLRFYEHGETPGLGAEIDDPAWLAQWPGTWTRDAAGNLRVDVARGRVDAQGPDAAYQVDGISGATRTSQAVGRLIRFWLGPDGYGPYLARLAAAGPDGSATP